MKMIDGGLGILLVVGLGVVGVAESVGSVPSSETVSVTSPLNQRNGSGQGNGSRQRKRDGSCQTQARLLDLVLIDDLL